MYRGWTIIGKKDTCPYCGEKVRSVAAGWPWPAVHPRCLLLPSGLPRCLLLPSGLPRCLLLPSGLPLCLLLPSGLPLLSPAPPRSNGLGRLPLRGFVTRVPSVALWRYGQVSLKNMFKNPWETQSLMWANLLDAVRYLIVWYPKP
jgi:hypothetical protein